MWCDCVGGDGLFWVGGIAEGEWEWGEVCRGEEGEGGGGVGGAYDSDGWAKRIYKGELGAKGGVESAVTGDNRIYEGSIFIKAVDCAEFHGTDVLDLQMGFFRWESFSDRGNSFISENGIYNGSLDEIILW